MIRMETIGDTSRTLASYKYLGLGANVKESFPQAGVKLDYDPAGDNSLSGFDRFGRVADQLWEKYHLGSVKGSPITAAESRPSFADFFGIITTPERREASRGPGAAMSALVGEWIRRKVPAWTPDSPIPVNRAGSSHPFVPSEPWARRILYCSRPQCPIRRTVQTKRLTRHLCGPSATVLVRDLVASPYAAWLACSRCQRRSRFQQISASLRATATRAIFALDRLRTRV